MELLIKNAYLVDSNQSFNGDIYVKDGKISQIGLNLNKNCKILDAKGKTLLPAFVDLHAHFRDPGYTYKEDIISGSKAAVKGGYTTVNLMPNTNPVCSNMDVVNYVLNKEKEINLIDVNQTISITNGLEGKNTSHINQLKNVKFISDDGKGVQNTRIMFNAMKKAKNKNICIIAHEEDDEIKDINTRLSENLMTLRDLVLASSTNCRFHVTHVSTKEAIEYVKKAKEKSKYITCDVTPHHISLTQDCNYKVNPPLRKQDDIDCLIRAIQENYVDVIATDHAPHSKEDKENGANGISGIETAFSVCYTKLVKNNYINLNKLVELMSYNPAKIFGIKKGKFEIGYYADFVLVDLNKKYKIDVNKFESKGKNSPLNGYEVFGEILKTIKSGKIVYEK